ncbi:MAG TPA: glycosyltransferase family 39 protein [Vicinamibacteria bacterium]
MKSSERVALALLLAVFFATRLVSLTELPIFLDESGHIRWAIWISQGKKLEKPWQYGKGLPVFVNALVFPWAHAHYLWASRALTVLFGAATMLGTILLGRRLGGPAVGWLAGLFYIVCPYALLYDRLALTDPAMGTFAVFVALLSLRVAEGGPRRDGALLGLALALAVFAKALGAILFFAPLTAALLIAPARLRRPGTLATAYAVGLALTAYALLRYVEVTATMRVAIGKEATGPLAHLADNLPTCWAWLRHYWTSGLIALGVIAVGRAVWQRSRPALFLAVFIAVPILALAAVADIWFPRYLVFLTGPFVALAAWGAHGLWTALRIRSSPAVARAAAAVGLALALLPAARLDLDVLRDPSRADLDDSDRWQYVIGWPSGYGGRDTIAYVHQERARHPGGIVVVTNSRAVRTTALALSLEFAYGEGVRLEDLNFDEPEGALPLLEAWARETPTLVVIEASQGKSRRPSPQLFAPMGGVLVARTYKPDGTPCDDIYRLCAGPACAR